MLFDVYEQICTMHTETNVLSWVFKLFKMISKASHFGLGQGVDENVKKRHIVSHI